ncbi:MAG: 1-acyl-sn-glycerol-3-phosphate acyltransferase [Paracidovorax wautersii]|uniref:1-acyl-sn-glycerol-3-phosphate acyltransferase n=1 Tax=Paracidovorax wautersii TaxID=1177982 RepID=A0A7V8FRL6_9BURK|nr:MAG: 1-acyl-sn-glycerol-3-phosphate acyltransferase [Paracidovorax wautersii]
MSQPEREAQVQWWARGMLERMGVALEVRGTPPAVAPVRTPVLLVANHLSWLDILVMHASRFCRFVSKDDVHGWPLVGTLATGAGTLYIERNSRRDAQRVAHAMANALQQGDVVAVFPEGTTGEGYEVLPFHANLLQSAIAVDAPAQPVALAYLNARTGAPSRDALYVGDDTLVGSLWRTLTAEGLRAVVIYGTPETAAGRSRREWAQGLRERVASQLEQALG